MSLLLSLAGKVWIIQGDDVDLIRWFESYFRTWVINNEYIVRDTIQSDMLRLHSKNLTLKMGNVAWVITLSKVINLRELNFIEQNLKTTLIIYAKNWNLIKSNAKGIVTLRFHKSYRDISWKNLGKLLSVHSEGLRNAFNHKVNLYDWLLINEFIPTIPNSNHNKLSWLGRWVSSGIKRMFQSLT